MTAPRVKMVKHLSLEERLAEGRHARDRTSPSSHSEWRPASDRPDPVALLEEQNLTREPDLVPVRHGRMMVSPFTFYRGAAKIMAADLKDTPVAGLDAQLCGDAHLSNFGMFASPERALLFDVNDFDETLPGPFEYDVKRMAASFVICGRNNGFSTADTRAVALASVTAYREAMAEFAQMGMMDLWYAHYDENRLQQLIQGAVTEAGKVEKKDKKVEKKDKKAEAAKAAKAEKKKEQADARQDKVVKKAARRAEKSIAKARTRDSTQALSKLAELVDGQYRIVSQPPVIVPARDLAATYGLSPDDVMPALHEQFRAYRATLPHDRRRLLEKFQIIDAARKVVGVGSVGTRAFIVLLQGRDEHDPLFLQVKEATASVLEAYLPKSRFRQHGERVVQGQRMMQAVGDIFLGWTKGVDVTRNFYWRQLRDMKGSALVDSMAPVTLTYYAQICGWTLARAHARSGDPVAMASYLGRDDAFDRSVTDFSERYADQNEQDYEQFVKAIRAGRLEAVEGV
ncbi:MAG TPA: DUF2252 domain-containing protein [Streptosporangiaceae bacterium]|nr:DUF2252 domain-containing protein [Streptosporangiaceae bacterium]